MAFYLVDYETTATPPPGAVYSTLGRAMRHAREKLRAQRGGVEGHAAIYAPDGEVTYLVLHADGEIVEEKAGNG